MNGPIFLANAAFVWLVSVVAEMTADKTCPNSAPQSRPTLLLVGGMVFAVPVLGFVGWRFGGPWAINASAVQNAKCVQEVSKQDRAAVLDKMPPSLTLACGSYALFDKKGFTVLRY